MNGAVYSLITYDVHPVTRKIVIGSVRVANSPPVKRDAVTRPWVKNGAVVGFETTCGQGLKRFWHRQVQGWLSDV